MRGNGEGDDVDAQTSAVVMRVFPASREEAQLAVFLVGDRFEGASVEGSDPGAYLYDDEAFPVLGNDVDFAPSRVVPVAFEDGQSRVFEDVAGVVLPRSP